MKNQAINLGRVGILLPIAVIFLFWIPVIGQLIGVAPLILLLISHHKFSALYQKPAIFKKMLIGFIISFVGGIIGGIIIGGAVAASLIGSGGSVEEVKFGEFFTGTSIIGTIIIFVAFIIGTYYMYRSLITLAEESNVKYFKTAGLLYFIGAITSIIFGLGFIVLFIGWIFHIIAYFSIQTDKPATQG